jgi:hypothetical protein
MPSVGEVELSVTERRRVVPPHAIAVARSSAPPIEVCCPPSMPTKREILSTLTHLVHEGHGRAFWAALGRVLPDAEQRRTGLASLGGRLLW